jgi:GTP-binding protein YchF
MTLKCGIVGLPNVGKSTLFNALTASISAAAANYPFCTIEPNYGIVAVPDKRLEQLSKIAGSAKIINAYIEFVDIAGLVSGASRGDGLGNKFLSHIREVDAIVHVLRCFDDDDVIHVHNNVNPVHDAEVVETELILSDLESVEKRIVATEKKNKSGDKSSQEFLKLLKGVCAVLSDGYPARNFDYSTFDPSDVKQLQLITTKPVIYVCNVLESEAASGNEYSEQVVRMISRKGYNANNDSRDSRCIVISSKIEAEVSQINDQEEKKAFLDMLGLSSSGLDKIICAGYDILDLKSYFTIGPKEAHAWAFKSGIRAPEAAGIIHSDFEKGFIRAEVISFNDYIKYNGEQKAKEAGQMRLEGKDYIVQDGDVVHFRFNV